MTSRRKFVKSVGSLWLVGTSGIASAKPNRGKGNDDDNGLNMRSSRDTGFQRSINNAFQKGGSEAVENLLVDKGVRYNHTTLSLNEQEESTDLGDAEYTIQEGFSKSDSEISVSTWGCVGSPNDEEITVSIHVGQTLKNTNMTWGSAKYVDDIIGVTWNGDHWEVVGNPIVEATEPHNGYFYSDSYQDEGIVAKVDLQTHNWSGWIEDKECVVNLSATVEYIGDNVTPIMGYYEHTEGLSGWDYIENINLVSDGVGIDLSNNARTLWEMAEFSNPENLI